MKTKTLWAVSPNWWSDRPYSYVKKSVEVEETDKTYRIANRRGDGVIMSYTTIRKSTMENSNTEYFETEQEADRYIIARLHDDILKYKENIRELRIKINRCEAQLESYEESKNV